MGWNLWRRKRVAPGFSACDSHLARLGASLRIEQQGHHVLHEVFWRWGSQSGALEEDTRRGWEGLAQETSRPTPGWRAGFPSICSGPIPAPADRLHRTLNCRSCIGPTKGHIGPLTFVVAARSQFASLSSLRDHKNCELAAIQNLSSRCEITILRSHDRCEIVITASIVTIFCRRCEITILDSPTRNLEPKRPLYLGDVWIYNDIYLIRVT